jgi:hypothetical protein
MYAGAGGIFSIILSAIFIQPGLLWIVGFGPILLLLVVRGHLGEITQKTENLFFWLVVAASLSVLSYIFSH